MKKTLLTLGAFCLFTFLSFGQAPEGFKYQTVVRDASGTILANQAIGIQIRILQGSASGTAVYTETFTSTTNGYGLSNLEIGTGTTTDDFSTIDWSAGPYFIETGLDATGGTSYSVLGASQLMSVPYALYAKNMPVNTSELNNDSGYITSPDDADSDPTNEIQTIVSTDAGNSITAGADGGAYYDASATGGDTDWTISGNDQYSGVTGNVGIGTTTPNEKLEVSGNILASGNVSAGNTGNVFFRDSVTPYWSSFNPNPACPTCPGVGIENGDSESGGFWANGNVATIWSPGDDYILRIYDEDGFPNPSTVQAYLDGSSGSPANWNAGAYNTISDMRIKENFAPISSPLYRLLQLKTYKYDIREDIAFKNELALGKEISEETRAMLKGQLGFKAQELKEIFPEVVHYSEGFQLYTVNYDMMVPVVIEGIKEQQKMIQDLQSENDELKAQLEALESRLEAAGL